MSWSPSIESGREVVQVWRAIRDRAAKQADGRACIVCGSETDSMVPVPGGSGLVQCHAHVEEPAG